MARSAVLAIFLIAIFSLQDRFEAADNDGMKTLDDYKTEIDSIDSAFRDGGKAIEELLVKAHLNLQNKLIDESFKNYTAIYREKLSIVNNDTTNPSYVYALERLKSVGTEEHKNYREALDTLSNCFQFTLEKNSFDMRSVHKCGIDLLEGFSQAVVNKCGEIANPQIRCRFIDDIATRDSFKNYQDMVLEKKNSRDTFNANAMTCAESVLNTWSQKVEYMKNRVLSITFDRKLNH